MSWIDFFVGLGAAFLSSLGFGGGTLLLLYLTLFQQVSQLESQGINLVFFLPVAAVAVGIYWKKRLICWKKAVPALLLGIAGAGIGFFCSGLIDETLLSKGFALLLLFIGLKELFQPASKKAD